MNNFVTTNIRIPEEDYLRLKGEAAIRRISLSAIVREKVGKKKKSNKDYAKMLLTLNTDWFTEKDYREYKNNRAQMEKKVKNLWNE